MGIKKLNKFLKEYNCIDEYPNISNLLNDNKKKIAIDTTLFIYKYKYSFDNFLIGFLIQIIKFIENDIKIVYIFDGKPPVEKTNVLISRKNKMNKIKEKIEKYKKLLTLSNNSYEYEKILEKYKKFKKKLITITNSDIKKIIKLLTIFRIPYIFSSSEADILCGKLAQLNKIDYVLSNDTDLLLYGCKKLIKFENKKVYCYDLNKILERIDLTHDQFIKMCILFGCDFFYGLYKLDNLEIYEKIKHKENINKILENYNLEYYEKNIKQFDNAYKLYTSPYLYTDEILFSNNKYNFKKLFNDIYKFDEKLINNKYNIYIKLKKISN